MTANIRQEAVERAALVRERIGGCGAVSPDNTSICVLDPNHSDAHGWDHSGAAATGERRPMCDHICLKDDGHVERGERHFYGYELPSPREAQEQLSEAIAQRDEKDRKIDALVSELIRVTDCWATERALCDRLAAKVRHHGLCHDCREARADYDAPPSH